MNTDRIFERLEKIAEKYLRIKTLSPRWSSSDDFYERAVWEIADALKAAYEAGRNADEWRIPESQNKTHGFWGTMTTAGQQGSSAWVAACDAIAKEITQPPRCIQPFLDSNFGQHFADGVLNCLHGGLAEDLDAAIEKLTKAWNAHKTDEKSGPAFGLPPNVFLLAGLVQQEWQRQNE